MKGQAYINGKDIWSEWGAILVKGTYEKLLKPTAMKEYISNSSRLQHGERIVVTPSIAKTEGRDLSIQVFIEGNSQSDYISKVSSFVGELEKGNLTLEVTKLNTTYKLVYIDCSSYGDFGLRKGKFTIKLREPNVKDRS